MPEATLDPGDQVSVVRHCGRVLAFTSPQNLLRQLRDNELLFVVYPGQQLKDDGMLGVLKTPDAVRKRLADDGERIWYAIRKERAYAVYLPQN